MVRLFFKIDPDYGERVAKGVGIPVELAKMWFDFYNLII